MPPPTAAATIGIVGLGYVGAVSAACMAYLGHQVHGFERDENKLLRLRDGLAPFHEPGLEPMLQSQLSSGRLQVHRDLEEALEKLDVLLVCVGTPSEADGRHNYSQLERVCQHVAGALSSASPARELIFAIRSTVTPGTTNRLGGRFFSRFPGVALAYNPEFLREGTAIRDFLEPPFVVAGADKPDVASRVIGLYHSLDAPKKALPIAAAEMVKGVCNAFHALKAAFANETGSLAALCGVDPGLLLDVVCSDSQLNISPAYLRPGFAFGGSCLPKDVRALVSLGRETNCRLPLYESILPSNDEHLLRAIERVEQIATKNIGLIGLSFKSDTDDLRESPALRLAAALAKKGYQIRVFDPDINVQLLHGANLAALKEIFPHGAGIFTAELDALMRWADCVVSTKSLPEPLRGRIGEFGLPSLDLTRL